MRILYENGDILTMKGSKPTYAECVLVEDGIIQKVRKKEEMKPLLDENTFIRDLKGNTMLPSFMDSHSHITALAQSLTLANLSHCKNFDAISKTVREYTKKKKIKKGEWIIGFGYDHNFLEEKKHPDCSVLDKTNLPNPICITHASGHMGVFNTIALEELGLTNMTNGYLEEKEFMEALQNIDFSQEGKLEQAVEEAQEIYLKNGITTVQDGLTKEKDFLLLQKVANHHKLKVDVICYPEFMQERHIVKENPSYQNYQNRLKIGGYKIVLDGSPQGKTAWLLEPYEGETKYKGHPNYSDAEVSLAVETAIKEGKQLLAHCNGDAASEQFIRTFEKQRKPIKIRPVMIHAQLVEKTQLIRMKEVNMIPSFFVNHVYYWGDVHMKNLGKRAERISPVKDAITLKLVYTLHQDSPVLMPNMLETIWCAAVRKTKEGVTLGKEEIISVYEALEGITKNVAYQYFEEDKKGTIEKGKLADFVVLDQNPLKVAKEEIKNIMILETIKEGTVLYRKGEKR